MKAHLKNQTIERWHAIKLDVAEGAYAVCGPDGKANAFIIGTEREQLATATLYSAAPKLLEACIAALSQLTEDRTEYLESDISQLRAAIAIAKGENK